MAGFKKKPCHAWTSGQKCRFGDKCHYSHDGPQSQNSSNVQKDRVALTSSETKLRAWSFKLKGSESLLTIDKLSKFFQTAQQLIDSEAGVRQDVVKSLATEGGLTRIAQVASQQYPFGTVLPSVVLREQIIPLFNVLTHPEIFSSLLMEEPVAVICGFLYGIEGQRLIRLCNLVIQGLKDTPADSQEIDAYFIVSLQLLSKIIDTKTESQVNKNLHPIANSFDELVKQRNDSQEQPDLHEASMLLARIQYRLGLGSELPAAIPSRRAKAAKASFVMQREPAGGRHNNDFGDIAQIEIMPTFDEITSRRAEYLPHLKFDENYVQGLDGVFDRHFRLLREDTIGQLRDAVQAEMEKLQHRGSNHSRNGTRTYSYNNLAIERLVPDPRCGFKLEISFDQPAPSGQNILSDGELARKNWWLQSKRLDPDALVCLAEVAGATGTILFCTVDQGSKPKGDKHHGRQFPDDTKAEMQFRALYSSKERGFVSLVLEDPTAENIQKLLRLCRRQAGRSTTLLVEFPGILLPAFKPTLLALKQMKQTGDLPLKDMLVPSPVVDEEQVQITPPAYTQKRGFRYNLKCLMSDSSDLFLTPGQPFDAQKLQTGSLLDDAQSKALVDSLCRSLALIQGPPGTGKSFVGVALTKVLLANKEMMIGGVSQTGAKGRNDIGPIIVVTYTNHALDQLLEHLHHAGVKQIIRIGSGCKSEVLQDCNLRSVARTEQRTKHEKSSFGQLRKEKEKEVDPQFRILNTINDSHSPTALKDFLLLRWSHHHDELFEQSVDDEGFQEVVYKRTKAPQHVFGTWLARGLPGVLAPRSVKTLTGCRLVEMSRAERYKLYHAWETQFQEDLEQKLLDAMTAHVSVKNRLDAIQEETDLRCLRAANIIGLTTSGLARNLAMLRKLRSKVLICEEAGEVLEAHLLTTFLPSVEHAILIGDHQQLRPQVQNYELRSDSLQGKQYSLDISLFERLVHPGPGMQHLPYSTLETQRRMHPSISRLIRETMYPALKDAANVEEYPGIAGLRKRLFWLDHTKPEGGDEADANQTSHFNAYEVQMTAALVRHIVNQGVYRPEEIAVLTPYLGQLQRLRNALGSAFAIVLSDRDVSDLGKAGIEEAMVEGQLSAQSISQTTLLRALRLSTVDNFQGEEAKMIILSLVRSNSQNKVGFLGTSNRINVALSRAKHGMIIIGNSQSASAKVAMWAEITAMLTEDGNLGPSLELQCPRHPDTPISITTPDDFSKFSPEGGCGLKCGDRLHCGHRCGASCHSQVLHDAVHCMEPCPRPLKGCNHSCTKHCGDKCPPKCQVNVLDATRMLPCGHMAKDLPCWQSQDLDLVQCKVKVKRSIPGCGHTIEVQCHEDVDSAMYSCKAKCGMNLPCSHPCRSLCYQCTTRTVDGTSVLYDTKHGSCKQICGRPFTNCSHSCGQLCHGDEPCPGCNSPCTNSCSHSRCGKFCSDPCRPCADENCSSGCEHSKCTMPCSAPCNHVPCSKRCNNPLTCGHQCPSICGEVCPSAKYCQVCTTDEAVKATTVDFIEMSSYEEVDLNLTPIIVPPCGHFLTAQSMDAQMSMSQYYEMDDDDKITGVKQTLSVPFSIDEIKRCATCRGSLRSIGRYGRLIRRAMLDEATKRFIVWSNAQYIPLAKALQIEQDALPEKEDGKAIQALSINGLILPGDVQSQAQTLWSLPGSRYKKLLKLRLDVFRYASMVCIEEQPFKRVLTLTQNPRLRREGVNSDLHSGDSLLQTRASVLAMALLLRTDLVTLSDVINLCQYASTNEQHGYFAFDFSENKQSCEQLIAMASDSSNRLQEVEGHMFYAQYTALERQFLDSEDQQASTKYRLALNHMAKAKQLSETYKYQTRAIHTELVAIEKMLRTGTFYDPVTSDEMKEVLTAMATEFRGTGHWYYCSNGHPFTIGECGMPMQTARCPQCGATIGGQNHAAVEGVSRAADLEEQLRGLAI